MSAEASTSRRVDLFSDAAVPECPTTGDADLRVKGTLAGNPVDLDELAISNISPGDLQVYDTYKTDAGFQVRINLELKWSGSLNQGVVTSLLGGTLYVPASQGTGHFYCFSEGEFAPVAASEQPPKGKLFKFRMRMLAAEENCSGGPVAGELTACIYRLNEYLP